MIRIVRIKRSYGMTPDGDQDSNNYIPAGHVWDFDIDNGKKEAEEAANFL